MRKTVAIKDVAAHAGVSIATVSHALSGRRPVSEPTRERILASVESLNYRPNLVARGLRRQETHTIGLIVADISNPFYPAIARAVHDRIATEGYVSFIGNTDGQAAAERRFLEEMRSRSVDGVIMAALSLTPAEISEILGPAIPLVLISNVAEATYSDQVGSIDDEGIRQATQHLVSGGIEDVAFIGGPTDAAGGTVRLNAFRNAAADAGLALREHWIVHAPFTFDGGFEASSTLLALNQPPRAIMCANDLIAIGAIEAARTLGLDVPGDLAVIGFDDIDTAKLISPRLTTIVNPTAQIGDACANALLRRIAEPGGPFQSISLSTHLVVRDSA